LNAVISEADGWKHTHTQTHKSSYSKDMNTLGLCHNT